MDSRSPLALVYGLKTNDPSYLDIFKPAKRIAEEALAFGLEYSAVLDPGHTIPFERGTTILLRGEIPLERFVAYESAGFRVVNPSLAHALAKDKWASLRRFEALGIRIPETVLLSTNRTEGGSSISDLESRLPFGFPCVVKPRLGKMGKGVRLITNKGEFREAIAVSSCAGESGGLLAQEYIGSSHGKDIRFFFARFSRYEAEKSGASFIVLDPGGYDEGNPGVHDERGISGAVVATRSSSGFLSNAHAGGTMGLFAPPPSLSRDALTVFAASGLRYGTVDFLFPESDMSRYPLCEINSEPGFEEFERATGLCAAGAIIRSAMYGHQERSSG